VPSIFVKDGQEVHRKITEKDYLEHLGSLVDDYLSSEDIVPIKMSKGANRYLEDVYDRIVASNEIFLESKIRPKFYFIKDDAPFYFSLPGGHYFFSSALISKYLKNEQLFGAVLCREIVKSHKNYYMKNKVIPVGFIDTAKILKLVRVPIDVRHVINKWVFVALRRTGLDPYAYLLWLQTQNKNSLEFTFQLGSNYLISKEEFLFKNFISSSGMRGKLFVDENAGVNKSFYTFYREVRNRHEAGRN